MCGWILGVGRLFACVNACEHTLAQCNASAHAPPKMAIAVLFPHKSDTFAKKSYIAKEIYMPAKERYIPAKELYYRCYSRVSAQQWRNRTLIGHEPLVCSKMCFSKTE